MTSCACSTLFRIRSAASLPIALSSSTHVASFFADLLNSPFGPADVVDPRAEHSERPETCSLFLSNDCAQGQAVVGRISRLRMRRVPAPDLEVEWTRYDRSRILFADELRQQQVKIHRGWLEAQANSLLQVPFD
jgi:hypothetical protein